MFKVTVNHLTPDALAAQPGTHELADCDAATLQILLENLRTLPAADAAAVADHNAEPEIIITAPAGKFLVRTGQRKLFLYNARDSNEPYTELTAAAIVQQLSDIAPPAASPVDEPMVVTQTKSTNRGAGIAILCVGLLLNGYTLYSVFYTERVNRPPPVTLLTEAAEIQKLTGTFAGTFKTGDEPGDRAIVIATDGTVRFIEFLPRERRADTPDTYQIGRYNGKLCFATKANGVIDVSNPDTLVYYRDLYRRVK